MPCKHSEYDICLDCRLENSEEIPGYYYKTFPLWEEDIPKTLESLYKLKLYFKDLIDGADIMIDRVQDRCKHTNKSKDPSTYGYSRHWNCDICNKELGVVKNGE